MDVRGAVFKSQDEDQEEEEEFPEHPVSSRKSDDQLLQRRINFRSETFAYSSDRTTIEDMADHVISR
jgi:hypothetical protein